MLRKLCLLFLLLSLLPACRLLPTDEDADITTPTRAIPTPANTPTAQQTRSEELTPTPPPTITLTVWMTSDISPRTEIPGGSVLTQQLAAFDESHPDVTLKVEIKTVTDQGGSLNYLRTGREVAPSILPDLILLPADQLNGAVAGDLIYPLNDLLQGEMLDDLFPAAETMSQVDNQLYGYPYTLTDLQHVAYNTNVITDTVPNTWDGIRNEALTYVFPADGPKGAELGLQFYLAAGGRLTNDAGQPQLDVEVLTTVLQSLSRARTEGAIAPQSSNVISLEGAWELLESGHASMTQSSANQFLNKRLLGFNGGFAPIPGPSGPLVPHVKGWLWAITTADPVQQALAVELIAWMTSPTNLGDWSLQSLSLPSRRSAFERWGNDPFADFLRQELERAQPFPSAATNGIMTALGGAVSDVVSLSRSAAAAANEAATAVNGP